MIEKPVPAGARVLMTGDHPVVRTAIARLIESEPGLHVVGECVNRCHELAEAMKLTPDIVVMDLDIERPDAVAQLLVHATRCPVLILTGSSDSQFLATVFAHGVLGVVLKNRPAEVLIRAIRAIVAGEAWMEPATLAHVFGAASPRRGPDLRARLTRREQEIVELVNLGLKNKLIGERLFITETTVRHHLTSIFNKLAVTSRLELMRDTYGGRVGRMEDERERRP
jgi:two-component system response regulator DegU